MSNLAVAYSALGRLQDALVMREKTLEFQRRVLPANHPQLGFECLNLGINLHKVGDLHRALLFAREALRVLQATLPSTHPRVADAQELVRRCEDDTNRRL